MLANKLFDEKGKVGNIACKTCAGLGVVKK